MCSDLLVRIPAGSCYPVLEVLAQIRRIMVESKEIMSSYRNHKSHSCSFIHSFIHSFLIII